MHGKKPGTEARLDALMSEAQQEINTLGDDANYGDTKQARPSHTCPIAHPYQCLIT
jgi:hypothetical protein